MGALAADCGLTWGTEVAARLDCRDQHPMTLEAPVFLSAHLKVDSFSSFPTHKRTELNPGFSYSSCVYNFLNLVLISFVLTHILVLIFWRVSYELSELISQV